MNKLFIIFSLVFSLSANAEDHSNTVTQDGYEVHYNAFPSSFLSPEVAGNYHITRSNNRGLLNVSIRKSADDNTSVAVKSKVIVTAGNLYGQNKDVGITEIDEAEEAVYYIGSFTISKGEVINFKVDVIPEDSEKSITFNFSHHF